MKRVLLSFCFVAALLRIPFSATAAGLIIVDDPDPEVTLVPGPGMPFPPNRLPRPIHRFTPLEIQSVKAEVKISDQVAETKIEQEFYNPNPRRLEGTFIFPLPKGAHLQKFRMEVNGKMTDAELLKADKAKGIYEEIVRKCKDPALLEYVGRDLLKLRIFPIEPNSTKRIEVSYGELLKNDSGLVEYDLPLNTAKYNAKPVKNFSLKLDLKSETPLKTIYSPTHSVEIRRDTSKTATIGFEQSEAAPDKDFQLFYSAERRDLGLSFLAHRTSGGEGYFMLLASPGFDQDKKTVLPKDVVFVIDTSGSMAGKKMEQARKALLFCVNNLNDRDRFEIIRFSTEIEPLFNNLRNVSSESRKVAETFVNDLKAIGGTAIHDALKKAVDIRPKESDRPYIVVFMTDGLPTVGETREEMILKHVTGQNRDLTRIFCFGVGTDVNTHLLDRIAEETRAVSQYVLPDEDLELKLSSFFSRISDPVLADIYIDFGGVRISKMHPGKLPDLFKGQQLIVLGRYKDGGKTTVKLNGKVGGERKEFSYKLDFPEVDGDHEFIPRLWATRRVGYLLDEIRLHGENAELKDEVTDLAKKYQIITPYTSFLITEDQPIPALSAASPGQVGGLGFYMRNPEMMKRYFPQLSRQMGVDSSNAQPDRFGVQPMIADRSGDAAVASARYSSALKTAVTEQQVQAAPVEVERFTMTGRLVSEARSRNEKIDTTRFVGSRTFRLQNAVWIEASLLDRKDTAGLTRIEFDSKEYWELLAKHTELRDIFALGTDVKFELDGKVCEIYSKNK